MTVSELSYATARTAYHRARLAWYSLRGRNALAGGTHQPDLFHEIRCAAGSRRAHLSTPAVVGEGPAGSLWRTAFGDFYVTKNLDPLFIRLTVEEQMSDVYLLPENMNVVLDCGANIGLFSTAALRRGAKKVIGFEPSLTNAACFRANMKDALADGRIELIEKGVHSTVGELRFTEFTKDPFANAVSAEGTIVVPVTTIDQAVEDLGLRELNFIKMDIEGSELEALDGAIKTLKRFRPRVSIATEHTSDFFANGCQVVAKMQSLGYDYVVTQALPMHSPSANAVVITPFCIAFTPNGTE